MFVWRVRKRPNLLSPKWIVHAPDGSWHGQYHTWKTAIQATNIAHQIETWLHGQNGG
jgi:hypothetical protein